MYFLFLEFSRIKAPLLKNRRKFPDFHSFEKFVEQTSDKEWLSRIMIVNWSRGNTEQYIRVLGECHVSLANAGMKLPSLINLECH